MEQRWIDWLIGFIFGIISSLVAEVIMIWFNSNSIVSKIINMIVQRKSVERLNKLQNNLPSNPSDPHAIVRADWACALFDLGSNNNEDLLKAMNSLYWMADLLKDDEKDVAHEALRLKFGTNQIRSLDSQYLKTMQKLQLGNIN